MENGMFEKYCAVKISAKPPMAHHCMRRSSGVGSGAFDDGAGRESEAYIRGIREERKPAAGFAGREIVLHDLRDAAPVQIADDGRERSYDQRAGQRPAYAVARAQCGDGGERGHPQRHGVENVDFEDLLPIRPRQTRDPITQAESERNRHDVPRAFQRHEKSPPGVRFAAFEALHLKAERHARHEEKQRRGHPADELREHVGAAVADIQAREGIEGVALDHDHHGQAAHPIEKGVSVHGFVALIITRGA